MAALMGAGTFGVHQLRFALAGGPAADPRQVEAHAYLVPLAPVLAGLLLVALATGLARVASGAADPVPRLRRLWAGASASLFAVYCAQESIEAALTHSHGSGWEWAAIGHGGWVALPLALAIGLAVALVMRGAAAAAALVVEAARAPWAPPAPAPAAEALLPPWAPRRTRAASRHLAARGPPLASV
jgi:hypothetical protein